MSNTKNKIIDIAGDLFFSQGFKAVAIDEISHQVGIKTASLYYHFPGGKEEIFIAAVLKEFENYCDKILGLTRDKKSIEEFLLDYGIWFCSQKQMNMVYITEKDMPHLSAKSQETLMETANEKLFFPFSKALTNFPERISREFNPAVVTTHYMTLLASVIPLQLIDQSSIESKVKDLTKIFTNGIIDKSN